MKCEHCGYDDHGTGDSSHMCPKFNRPTIADRLQGHPVALGLLASQGERHPDYEARYRWLQDWYFREGRRAEIDPHGHVRQTTPAIMDAAIDAAIASRS